MWELLARLSGQVGEADANLDLRLSATSPSPESSSFASKTHLPLTSHKTSDARFPHHDRPVSPDHESHPSLGRGPNCFCPRCSMSRRRDRDSAIQGPSPQNPSCGGTTTAATHDSNNPFEQQDSSRRSPASDSSTDAASSFSTLHLSSKQPQPVHDLPVSQLRNSTIHADLSKVNLDSLRDPQSAGQQILRDAIFPKWKNDASSGDFDDPDEMQKRDPLNVEVWKLFSRTKSQLPAQERVENLTWRMMGITLKKQQQEQQALQHGQRQHM